MPYVRYHAEGKVVTLTLDRPERKNPLTFESYAELRDYFRALAADASVRAVVITGQGENFCSGGDVHEIIGPLTRRSADELLEFTQMTGDLVKAMRDCPQPIIAAVDGVCAGAGAILAMASDLRYGTARSKVAFLFVRVGLAGCDMGACAMLPRIIGQGRAAELLFTGRAIDGNEAYSWGFYNGLHEPARVLPAAREVASTLANGPTLAHAMTKRMLHDEWNMPLDAAINAEARAQAGCMGTNDFRRAYEAFAAGTRPKIRGKLRCRMARFSPGHFSRIVTARSRVTLRSGFRSMLPPRPRTSTRYARSGFVRSRAAGGCRRASTWTRERYVLRVKYWPITIRWAISHLPCKGWAAGRSRFSERRSKNNGFCRASHLVTSSPHSRFPNGKPVPTSPQLRLAHSARATITSWTARRCGSRNAGIADLYVIFARTSADGAKGLSAFIVPADSPGLSVPERIETISPHPLGVVHLNRCRVPAANRIGEEGHGFKIAMATLDIFRPTVGAAALGFAQRALDETVAHVRTRMLFGQPLAAQQMTQARIADMATSIDAAALLVYRAAYVKDSGAQRVTREAAMAKWYATEAASRVADGAVQLFGSRGVRRGEIVERIYRDVRALRIYEGASEIQQVVIARSVLEEH